MKMAPGLFWGVLLILIGLAAIFKVIFDVNLFSILFALFLIFIGVTMLIGRPWMFHHHRGARDTMFEERTFTESPGDNTEYNVIFGRSVYDFRDFKFPDNKPLKVKVNTIFGNAVIKIDKNKPVKIKSDAVFGSATMPDGNSVAFGSINYQTKAFAADSNTLYIEAPVVFGSLQVKEE